MSATHLFVYYILFQVHPNFLREKKSTQIRSYEGFLYFNFFSFKWCFHLYGSPKLLVPGANFNQISELGHIVPFCFQIFREVLLLVSGNFPFVLIDGFIPKLTPPLGSGSPMNRQLVSCGNVPYIVYIDSSRLRTKPFRGLLRRVVFWSSASMPKSIHVEKVTRIFEILLVAGG